MALHATIVPARGAARDTRLALWSPPSERGRVDRDDPLRPPLGRRVQGHELDEADGQVALPGKPGEIDDLVVVEAPNHHAVHLDPLEPGLLSRLQASGLQASRTARALQNKNADARSELEVWRGAYLPYLTPTSRSCTTTAAGCTVEIRPCVVAGQDLKCDRPSVTAAAAHAVTVTVEEEGRVIALTTVVLR